MDAPLNVKLTIVHNEDPDWDWYVIERAEHDGRAWMERTGPSSSALRLSSRIGTADIEGTRAEMLELARAIKAGGRASFKRCSVVTMPDGVRMCSPRNSIDDTLVTHEAAQALADEILAKLSPLTQPEASPATAE